MLHDVEDGEDCAHGAGSYALRGRRARAVTSRILRTGAALLLLALARPAAATDAPPGTISLSYDQPWKLTLGAYRTGADSALDVNLRRSLGDFDAWIAGYAETAPGGARDGVVRVGADWNFRSELFRFTPTVAWASNGFVGGQLYAEVGGAEYLVAGYSQTNLKDYFNLTFDPNESVQLGAGIEPGRRDRIQLFTVFDVRLGTGQQDTHLYWRHALAPGRRLTFDVLFKSGHTDGGTYVRGVGAGATFDGPWWFVRAAFDPYANFGDRAMWRVGGGIRF